MVSKRRAYTNLSADIEEIISTVDRRLNAVMRQSIQDVIDNAQTPTAKGGRMRVDTGFLRASGAASLLGMPAGPGRGDPDALPDTYSYKGDVTVSLLAKLKIGAVFYFGWTANYAKHRELYDGFLEGALQHWPRIVAFNTDTIKKRIK